MNDIPVIEFWSEEVATLLSSFVSDCEDLFSLVENVLNMFDTWLVWTCCDLIKGDFSQGRMWYENALDFTYNVACSKYVKISNLYSTIYIDTHYVNLTLEPLVSWCKVAILFVLLQQYMFEVLFDWSNSLLWLPKNK